MRRTPLIIGWFVVLFVFNVVVHHNPATTHLVADSVLDGVAYIVSPLEIIASVGAIWFIVSRTRKMTGTPDSAEPTTQNK